LVKADGPSVDQPNQMSKPHILVIAPESDLKSSLHFALAAELFDVTWQASIGAKPVPGDYDCTIIDHHALGQDPAAAKRFAQAFAPVILLANRTHELSPFVFRTILKPHLGAPLIEAVRDALALSQPTK
jgi:hypothetical protein